MKSSRHMAQASDQQHIIYLGVDQQLCKIISSFIKQVKKHLLKEIIRPLVVPQRMERCFSLSALFMILRNQQNKKALAYESRIKCVSKPLLPVLPPDQLQPLNCKLSASHTDKTMRFGNLFAPKIMLFGQTVLTVKEILKAMKKTRQLYQ